MVMAHALVLWHDRGHGQQEVLVHISRTPSFVEIRNKIKPTVICFQKVVYLFLLGLPSLFVLSAFVLASAFSGCEVESSLCVNTLALV